MLVISIPLERRPSFPLPLPLVLLFLSRLQCRPSHSFLSFLSMTRVAKRLSFSPPSQSVYRQHSDSLSPNDQLEPHLDDSTRPHPLRLRFQRLQRTLLEFLEVECGWCGRGGGGSGGGGRRGRERDGDRATNETDRVADGVAAGGEEARRRDGEVLGRWRGVGHGFWEGEGGQLLLDGRKMKRRGEALTSLCASVPYKSRIQEEEEGKARTRRPPCALLTPSCVPLSARRAERGWEKHEAAFQLCPQSQRRRRSIVETMETAGT